MSFFKYLKYQTYEYDSDDDLEFLKSDSKIITLICSMIVALMSGILILICVKPELRYDSGMDNLPKLIISVIAGIIGVILNIIPIKNQKVYVIERRISRFYMSMIFISLFIYEIIMSNAKADGMLVYLMYCILALTVLHVNPIVYTAQTIIVLICTSGLIAEYFNSLGTMFSYVGLLAGSIVIAFYQNICKHENLHSGKKLSVKKQQLEYELELKQNELLYNIQKQIGMQEDVILAIANLVENRDMDTGSHIKATAYYAKLIADGALEAGLYSDILDDDFTYLIEKAAPMHDLGKIAISDAILKAPRRLTDDEFEIMKTHTIKGSDAIRNIYTGLETDEFIDCASNIAKYHHERWDGKGYPENLSGYNIPLEARIMAIADVFDALVSKRCYKDAYPLSEAFNEIIDNAGTQFDPALVGIFVKYRVRIEEMVVGDFEDIR